MHILKYVRDVSYDEKNEIIYYKGTPIDAETVYRSFLKKNGMSFNCICDIHWECMSILECTECGTVIKYYYNESYEPEFRCPICTGYKYYTKEEIEKSS